MQDFGTKIDNNPPPGGQLTAAEFNNLALENETAVLRSGQALDGGRTNQFAESLFLHSVKSQGFQDSGSINTYVCTPISGSTGVLIPASYSNMNGARISFIAANGNSGNSTINIGQTTGTLIGAKKLLTTTGAEISGGSISAGDYVQAQYNASLDGGSGAWMILEFQAIPSGVVLPFAMSSAPVGFLKANGAAVSRSTYSSLFANLVTNAGFTSQTFTVTIASPAIFTKSAHGFQAWERLRLSTTGALPTGLNTSTDYFVERIDANTFYLTDSVGARINTSGTQSGTHSYLQSWWGLGDGMTTFNLPDMRGEFPRGWDDGRGVDSGRSFGARQVGTAHNFDIGPSAAVLGDRVSVTTDPATGRQGIGMDAGTTTEYSANAGFYSAASSNTGGLTNSTDLAWGVMRPRNIPLLYCIKY